MTTIYCHADLQRMIEAVEILSPTQYTFLGEGRDFAAGGPVAAWPAGDGLATTAPTLPDDPTPATPPRFLSFLEQELYARLYIQPANGGGQISNMLAQRDHLSALSAANSGQGTWEPGWKIIAADPDGRVAVTKDQVTFWVPPTGLRTSSGKVTPGSPCRVRVGKELRYLMPGFYFAIGDGNEQDHRDTTEPLLRCYWHLTAAAAAPYLERVTRLFNAAGIPFRTKVIADPGGYIRADAGVLYFERRYFRAARTLILDIHRTIRPGLRPAVPLCTKPLADGLGLAEDPHNGLSFGQARCRVVAQTLWQCFTAGQTDPVARLITLERMFKQAGLDPLRPFLDRQSSDVYSLAGQPASPRRAVPLVEGTRSGSRRSAGGRR